MIYAFAILVSRHSVPTLYPVYIDNQEVVNTIKKSLEEAGFYFNLIENQNDYKITVPFGDIFFGYDAEIVYITTEIILVDKEKEIFISFVGREISIFYEERAWVERPIKIQFEREHNLNVIGVFFNSSRIVQSEEDIILTMKEIEQDLEQQIQNFIRQLKENP